MRYKDENKKDSINYAAIQIINEIGLAEASVAKIAKKAGVSSATLYIYFENKNDMIKKLYLTIKRDMHKKVFHGIDSSLSIKTGFELILKNHINYFLNNKDYFLFYEQCVNSPLIQGLCYEETQIVVKPFVDFIENGKKQNVFKNVDTYLIFVYAISPLIQIAKQYFNEKYVLDEKNINEAISMGWDAVKA